MEVQHPVDYLPGYPGKIPLTEAFTDGLGCEFQASIPLTTQDSYSLTTEVWDDDAISRRHYALDGLAALPTGEPTPPNRAPQPRRPGRFLAVTQT